MARKKKTVEKVGPILAIIGTAGRHEDFNKYTIEKWNESKRILFKIIKENNFKSVISGGAAHSDHFAIQLYLKDIIENLYLELPCEFDNNKVEFYDEKDYNTGNITTYHHQTFSQKFCIESLQEVKSAIKKGAKCTIGGGFWERNIAIATKASDLIAFTFGNGAKVKEKSGTAHTVRAFLNRHPEGKTWHVDLNTMDVYNKIEI